MMSQLKPFYMDYAYDVDQFKYIIDTQAKAMAYVANHINQIKRNTMLESIECYRNLLDQSVPIGNGYYTIESIVSNPSVYSLGFMNGLPVRENTLRWINSDITNSQKIRCLEICGKKITLQDTDYQNEKLNIISLDIFMGRRMLNRYSDYDIVGNNIYLLNPIADEHDLLTLTNIVADINTPDRLLGDTLKLSRPVSIIKPDYIDIVKRLTRVALKGPSLRGTKEALGIILGIPTDEVKLYDKYSATSEQRKEWDNFNKSPFEYDITISEDTFNNKEITSMILEYLSIVKPSYSTFAMSVESIVNELYDTYTDVSISYLDIMDEMTEVFYLDTVDRFDSTLNNTRKNLNTTFRVSGFKRAIIIEYPMFDAIFETSDIYDKSSPVTRLNTDLSHLNTTFDLTSAERMSDGHIDTAISLRDQNQRVLFGESPESDVKQPDYTDDSDDVFDYS